MGYLILVPFLLVKVFETNVFPKTNFWRNILNPLALGVEVTLGNFRKAAGDNMATLPFCQDPKVRQHCPWQLSLVTIGNFEFLWKLPKAASNTFWRKQWRKAVKCTGLDQKIDNNITSYLPLCGQVGQLIALDNTAKFYSSCTWQHCPWQLSKIVQHCHWKLAKAAIGKTLKLPFLKRQVLMLQMAVFGRKPTA